MSCQDAWVADDSVASRRLLEMTLKKTGLSTRAFESGIEALNVFTKGDCSPQLIVLDSEMPDMDGCMTARMFRRAGYEGVLVLCSGSENEALTARALRSGFDFITIKDAGFSELKNLLQSKVCLLPATDPGSSADEPGQAPTEARSRRSA